jgi:putative ABC transport system permease protein
MMRQVTFILQTSTDPAALAEPVRAIVREVDPSLPVYNARTYDAAVARTVARPRFTALLLSVFAAFGLALGALGVYGVLAYTVAERTHELGIRRALGAPAGGLVRLMLWRGLTPVVVGVGAGVLTALALSGLLQEQLFGIAPTDKATYVATVVGVLATSIAACLIPTRRALRVSPVVALREY